MITDLSQNNWIIIANMNFNFYMSDNWATVSHKYDQFELAGLTLAKPGRPTLPIVA